MLCVIFISLITLCMSRSIPDFDEFMPYRGQMFSVYNGYFFGIGDRYLEYNLDPPVQFRSLSHNISRGIRLDAVSISHCENIGIPLEFAGHVYEAHEAQCQLRRDDQVTVRIDFTTKKRIEQLSVVAVELNNRDVDRDTNDIAILSMENYNVCDSQYNLECPLLSGNHYFIEYTLKVQNYMLVFMRSNLRFEFRSLPVVDRDGNPSSPEVEFNLYFEGLRD